MGREEECFRERLKILGPHPHEEAPLYRFWLFRLSRASYCQRAERSVEGDQTLQHRCYSLDLAVFSTYIHSYLPTLSYEYSKDEKKKKKKRKIKMRADEWY